MTAVSKRDSARARAAVCGFAAATLALTAAACFTGANTDSSPLTGVIGPTGTGSSGSGGTLYAGTYALTDVNDSTLPFQLAYDSAAGGDTVRVFQAWMDSSYIYLNDDSTAAETDYLTIRDVRTATDSSFNREITFGDTLTGSFSATNSTITIDLTDTTSGIVDVTYTVSGSTFSGAVPYELYNTDNQLAASGTATYEFAYIGAASSTMAVPGMRKARNQSRSMIALQDRAAIGPARVRTSAVSGAGAQSRMRVWRVPAWALAAAARQASFGPAHTRP
jgi:hypothetical protein